MKSLDRCQAVDFTVYEDFGIANYLVSSRISFLSLESYKILGVYLIFCNTLDVVNLLCDLNQGIPYVYAAAPAFYG